MVLPCAGRSRRSLAPAREAALPAPFRQFRTIHLTNTRAGKTLVKGEARFGNSRRPAHVGLVGLARAIDRMESVRRAGSSEPPSANSRGAAQATNNRITQTGSLEQKHSIPIRRVVTSKQMRHVVPILLCLILVLGGLCSSLCLAQTPANRQAHSCCQEKNHCGHAGPAMKSHQARRPAPISPFPIVLPAPVSSKSLQFLESSDPLQPQPIDFSPPLQTSVLRL